MLINEVELKQSTLTLRQTPAYPVRPRPQIQCWCCCYVWLLTSYYSMHLPMKRCSEWV